MAEEKVFLLTKFNGKQTDVQPSQRTLLYTPSGQVYFIRTKDPSGSEDLILGLQHPGEQVMFLQMGGSVIQV